MNKYRALRLVASFYAAIGILIIIVGVLSGVFSFIGTTSNPRIGGGFLLGLFYMILSIISSAVVGIGLIAFGQVIEVLLSIEQSSRETAQALKARLRR